jgi:hypothetical protein
LGGAKASHLPQHIKGTNPESHRLLGGGDAASGPFSTTTGLGFSDRGADASTCEPRRKIAGFFSSRPPMNKTIVIFRKDRTGWKDCFALFPELPADNYGHYCDSYQHIGQHCSADYHGCIAASDAAKPDEYADLFEELERRGYNLVVRQRATPEMHERRRRMAAEWRTVRA